MTTETVTEQTMTTIGQSEAAAFKAAVKAVALAAGKDNTLPVLTGVQLSKTGNVLTLAATNRYLLFVAEITVEDAGAPDFSVLLPAKELGEVTKSKSRFLTITVEDGSASFNDWEVTRTIRALDGEYPAVAVTDGGARPRNGREC